MDLSLPSNQVSLWDKKNPYNLQLVTTTKNHLSVIYTQISYNSSKIIMTKGNIKGQLTSI